MLYSPYRAPGVRVAFTLVDRVPVGNEGIVHFPKGRITPAEKVQTLATLGVRFYGLLEELHGRQLPVRLLSQTLNSVVHPSQLALYVRTQVVGQVRLLQQVLVGFPRRLVLVL